MAFSKETKAAKTIKTAKTAKKKATATKSSFVPKKTTPVSAAPPNYPKLGSSVVTPDGHAAIVVKHKTRRSGPAVLCKLSDGSTHLHELSKIKLS